MSETGTLISFLRRGVTAWLPQGWLFLSEAPPWSPATKCILLTSEEMDRDDAELNEMTTGAGYPCEGLDTQTLEGVVRSVLEFGDTPSDDLLLESFTYYHRFDAYLPEPNAPEPPPWEETERQLDREFYDCLGDERPKVPCRREGCSRGAVKFSVFCRPHHFESIKNRPSPFTD